MPGSYKVQWDGTDKNGREVANGMYIYQMQTEGFQESKRMMLLK